ncbi:MAG: hypothetical protein OQJ81_10945 [Melioribacteraceae bacterium]|nr:hypothetical protein [Melioribacteraceae bacterium]
MDEKFKFVYDDETNILYKYYYGEIKLEDIISSWDYAINNNLIPKSTKGFIMDYRNASLGIKITESHKIAAYYKKNIDIFGNYKIAILTKNPKDIVIPTLVESKDDGYFSKPFYTLEAAIRWVLI